MSINLRSSTLRVAVAIAATAAVAFAGGVYWTHSAGTVAAAPDVAPAGHGWLGMALAPITDAVATKLGIQKQDGLAVVNVAPDGPAAKAGVQKADVVKSINGATVTDLKTAMAKLKDVKPGDTVQFAIVTGTTTKTISVTAAAAPQRSKPGQPPANGRRGPGGPGHGPGGPGGGVGMAPFAAPFGMLPELQGIAPQDMFDHMMGGSFKFKDKNNNDLTITMTDGKVVSATDTSVVVKPNGGGANLTYGITADTKLRGKGSGLKADTRVVVITKNAATDALAIMNPGQRSGPQGGAKPNSGNGRTSAFEGFGGDFGGFMQGGGPGAMPQWGQGGFSGGPMQGFRQGRWGAMPNEAPATGF